MGWTQVGVQHSTTGSGEPHSPAIWGSGFAPDPIGACAGPRSLMTGWLRASRLGLRLSVASAWPLLPAEVQDSARRGPGRGVSRGPSGAGKGAGKGRGAGRMCGSACLPGGRGGFPKPAPVTSPSRTPPRARPERDQKHRRPHPGRTREVTGRAGCALRARLASGAARPPARQARRDAGFGSHDLPAPRTRLPSSPPRLPKTPRARGFPGKWGTVPRRVPPPPCSRGSTVETESRTTRALSEQFPSVPRKRSPCRSPQRSAHFRAPRSRPAPPGAGPDALAAQGGSYLSFWHSWSGRCCAPPHPTPTADAPQPTQRPLGAGAAGLGQLAPSPRLWLLPRLQLLPAPPPAQFLPPDSARRDGAGPARPGGRRGWILRLCAG